MLKFKDIILQTIFQKALVKEGGNAVSNVDRIEKDDIDQTVKEIKEQLLGLYNRINRF